MDTKKVNFSIMGFLMRDFENLGLLKDICPRCHYIYECGDKTRSGKCSCPNCHNDKPELWPHFNLFVLIDRWYLLRKERKAEELSVVIFCSVFEGLFDSFLQRYILEKEKTSPKIMELLWKRYAGLEQRVDSLYKSVITISFKEDLSNLGHREFYEKWKMIKKTRDDFIHLNNTLIDAHIVNSAFELLSEMFNIFVKLNNKYLIKT